MKTQHNSRKDPRRLLPVSVLLLLVLTALIPSEETSAGAAGSTQRNDPTLIFAIAGEPDEYHMDAVAIFSGRQFTAPFSEEKKEAQKNFAEKYFAAGKSYRLIFGGGEAGTVTLQKWSEGCNSIHSEVTASTSAKLSGQIRALATNNDALGRRASSRRAPTDAERAAVMKLVKSIYTRRRTPASLTSSIKVTNITATDLDGDGKHELVGSFTLASRATMREGSNKFERDLFLIAKSGTAGMRADFAKFQAYRPPPEEFLSSIDFIDQLDVDGNGVGEVFAVQGGFDGYGYLIFRKVRGRWREVYQGLGDVC